MAKPNKKKPWRKQAFLPISRSVWTDPGGKKAMKTATMGFQLKLIPKLVECNDQMLGSWALKVGMVGINLLGIGRFIICIVKSVSR